MRLPLVAIVGRPNTGKSTLFNALIGSRKAIESEEPGTTRDRIFHRVEHPDTNFGLVDTAGLEFGEKGGLEVDVRAQAQLGAEQADLIAFVVDGRSEITREDAQVADYLRKTILKKPLLLIANKCDNPAMEEGLSGWYQLGLGNPHPISAIHKRGVEDLKDEIAALLKKKGFQAKSTEEKNLPVALVGRPNVGKSSLINALLRESRLLVSSLPGTTRDAVDSLIVREGKTFNFIDTAGLVRASKKKQGIPYLAALRSLKAIERAEVVLLVIDSTEPLTHQDQLLARAAAEAGKGLILLANKWDLKKDETEEEKRRAVMIRRLQQKFPFTPWAPVIFTSAVTKKNLAPIFDQIESVARERQKEIKTHELNSFIRQLSSSEGRGHWPKLKYITQTGTQPPAFVVFVNQKKKVTSAFSRHVERRFREKFGFTGTPLWMNYREDRKP